MGAGLAGLVCLIFFSLRKRWLSGSGAAGAALIGGGLVMLDEWNYIALIVLFFIASSLVSRLGAGKKEALARGSVEKGSARDFWQVAANGGVPFATAVVYRFYPAPGWHAAFLGSLAAAMADTWGTEIGLLLGVRPRSILTWRPVPPGLSGGVTAAGYAGCVAGSALLGAAASMLTGFSAEPLAICMAGGLAGTTLDSAIGASAQAVFRCPACAKETETPVHSCGASTIHVRGFRFLTNDGVNFAAALVGACAGWFLALRF